MLQSAVFGGGCFWCIEAAFQRLRGVTAVTSGYTGGHIDNPTYEAVCSGSTGHVEVVKVDFYDEQIAFRDLLTVFFAMHDPTTRNRQGNDVGEQYRSAIFVTTPEQEAEARSFIAELARDNVFTKPIVTEVAMLPKFFPAESYHQRYYNRNVDQPYCAFIINPKLKKLKERFAELLKTEGEV